MQARAIPSGPTDNGQICLDYNIIKKKNNSDDDNELATCLSRFSNKPEQSVQTLEKHKNKEKQFELNVYITLLLF